MQYFYKKGQKVVALGNVYQRLRTPGLGALRDIPLGLQHYCEYFFCLEYEIVFHYLTDKTISALPIANKLTILFWRCFCNYKKQNKTFLFLHKERP